MFEQILMNEQLGAMPSKFIYFSYLISASSSYENLGFTIEDNGVGMTEETISQVLSHEKAIRKGYGIKNINDRIQLAFGEKYGLTYSSVLGEGTRVVITLPAVSTLQN